jgi:hypothetical protein
MRGAIRSLLVVTFAAFASSAHAITVVPNPSDFGIAEAPGQYTVFNNSSDWYIFAFAVSNPNAQNASATATSTFANWNGFKVQLDLGGIIPVWTFAYATADANLSNINSPTLPIFNTADLIGPHSSSNLFFFSPPNLGSDYGMVLINSNELTIDSVNGITSETPLPAALPLFVTGLGALGLLGWRRKRRTQLQTPQQSDAV